MKKEHIKKESRMLWYARKILVTLLLVDAALDGILITYEGIIEKASYVIYADAGIYISDLTRELAISHIGNIFYVSMILSLLARFSYRYTQAKPYTFYNFLIDILQAFKVALISLALTQGLFGVFQVALILIIEKFPETNLGRWCTLNLSSFFQGLVFCLHTAVCYIMVTSYFTLQRFFYQKFYLILFHISYYLGDDIYYFMSTSGIASWLMHLFLIIGFSYMHGHTLNELFYVGESKTDKKTSTSIYNEAKDILKAFILSSPSVLYFIYIIFLYGFSIWLQSWSTGYCVFAFSQMVYFSVQPLVEELYTRSLGIYYMVSEGYLSNKIDERSLINIILCSLLNGWLFAVMHQSAYIPLTLYGFVSLAAAGMSYCAIVLFQGNISAPVLFHALHNYSIACIAYSLEIGIYFEKCINIEHASSVIAGSIRVGYICKEEIQAKLASKLNYMSSRMGNFSKHFCYNFGV